ncbi:hypothetical protein Y1Q_0022570 [Alligator mississippiensis]|uniref:Protein turtle-like protein B n=1 Tax=Alligator mississippiensis TaxID=8496 RepID=A0A151NQI9_ALLMI|nr:hypothetical protein Y1Q_0022570 [Alligator mississippiensis]
MWLYYTWRSTRLAPPTFTETPPQYVEAKEGSSITLTCMAFGNPKPIVTWLKEGDLLGAGGKYQVSDGSLTVISVSREDRGAYTCRAYSIQGEAVHTTRLLVQGPPFIVSPPENITVNISQDALFTCQAEAYPGNLTYTWYWEEENVYFKNDLKLRVRILIDGTLIIFRVKPEDSGKYTCIPSNSLGRSPSAFAYLTVQYPARVVNMPPIIYVPIGIHGYIRCPVEAEPPVTIVKWNKDGRPLRIEKMSPSCYSGWNVMEDGSIRIEEATEEALGTYTCVPYNALGTMGQSPPARLVLKDPPYFTVLPGWEYRQEAGRELLIPCAAAGDPFPVIAWRKVGKPSRSKHNTLPSGSLQFRSLSKDDHGEWECVATNIVTSITASTHLTVVGTSPHAPSNVRVVVSMTSANVSWEPGYDGGYEQTFSVWMKRAQFGPHDWLSLPVPSGSSWLLVDTLEPETAYQFSVLAQNKLGTSSFSEVVTVNTLAFPVTTPEPLVLVTPPRCLTANRTQQGVLLSWLPPANHSFPIDHYIMEFRVGERWEILDDAILGSDNDFFAKDLSQDTWYEFRVLAVMQDLISEPSNIAGVSSTDVFPQPDLTDDGLARPVLAGIVATICFLAAAILFSTLAACFVNKQRKRKLKRKKDPPLSITHCRKSLESPLSSGKVSPESIRTLRPPSESSDDQGPPGKRMLSPSKEKELSLYKKTKRAISSKKYSVSKAEAEAEATTPIELISRGPDGRFVMDPSEMEPSLKTRRIEGFPFVEETDMYPEFRQSDEENDDPMMPSSGSSLPVDSMDVFGEIPSPRRAGEEILRPEPTSTTLSTSGSLRFGTFRVLGCVLSMKRHFLALGFPGKFSLVCLFVFYLFLTVSLTMPQDRDSRQSHPATTSPKGMLQPQDSGRERKRGLSHTSASIWAVLSRQASPQLNRKRPSPSQNAAAPERLEALKYQRIKKPKKSSKGSSKSKKQSNGSASQVQQLPNSQVLWPDEAVCLRKKKRHPRQDPFARLSALKDDLCHRQLPEDQTAILNSVDHDDSSGHATLL